MHNKKSFTLKYGVYLLIVIALTIFDQFTKALAVGKLKGKTDFVIWDGVFELSYVENRGAAFGMQQGKVIMFVIITFILIPVMIYAIHKIDRLISAMSNNVHRKGLLLLQIDFVILIAGAIGNLIDRLANGYVVDFLYFKLIDFPVFNIADCYVTVATVLLIIICFFILSEKELDYIICSEKKWRARYESTEKQNEKEDNDED